MKKTFALLLLCNAFVCLAQTDTSKVLRAFPITSYIIDLTDSSKLVQLEMPEVTKLAEKQIGLLYGVYDGDRKATVQKGYGKCHLIKGNYYYFAIGNNNSGLQIKKGDLLYTYLKKTNIYDGFFPKLASHFIRLQDVYDEPFYDRYLIFLKWTKADEEKILDSIIKDIIFTGNYFIENNPGIDKAITTGKYAGKKTLSVMTACNTSDLSDFFNYIIARPRLYAGKEWKVSEIFATWLSEGAPTVMPD
ncbi:MAG: hypothetical protein ABIP79_04325 [Chitinophagaceae bacterium]